MEPKTLGDGCVGCDLCGVYYPFRIWRKGLHQNSVRCKKAQAERPMREAAMKEASSSINKFMERET